ncbi:MAG: carboxypeptidase regulatory-like domain-containing protein [bacterium]
MPRHLIAIVSLIAFKLSFSQPGIVIDPEHFEVRLPYGADEEEVMNISNLTESPITIVPTLGPEERRRTVNIVIWTAFITNDRTLTNLLNSLNTLPAYQRRVNLNSSRPEDLAQALSTAHLFILPYQDAASPETLFTIGESWRGILEDFTRQGGFIVALEAEYGLSDLLRGAGIMDIEILEIGRDFVCSVIDDSPLSSGVRSYTAIGRNSIHRLRGEGWVVAQSQEPLGAHISARYVNRGGVVYYGSQWWIVNPAMERLFHNALMWFSGGYTWLDVVTDTLTIPPDESMDLFFRIDARAIREPGEYERSLILQTSLPEEPNLEIPISMTVAPPYKVEFEVLPNRVFIISQRDTSITLRIVNFGEGFLRATIQLRDTTQRWLVPNRTYVTLSGGIEDRLLLRFYADSVPQEFVGNELIFRSAHPQEQEKSVPVIYYTGNEFGAVIGTVREQGSGIPVSRAQVNLYGLATFTDNEGNFSLSSVPVGLYQLEVEHPEYLLYRSEWLNVENQETTEVSITLNWSDATVQIDLPDIITLPPISSRSIPGRLINSGPGAFIYNAIPIDRVFEDRHSPWQRISEFSFSTVGRSPIFGIAYDGEFIWLCGLSGIDQVPYLWLFRSQEELIDSFPQPVDYPLGFSDLTWDGHLVWGSDFGRLKGINREGRVEEEIRIPIRYARGVAYSPQDSTFYITEARGTIFQVTRGGRVLREIERPDRECYGLAYNGSRRDGYELYLHLAYGPTGSQIIRIKPHTGEWLWEENLFREGDESPGGCEVSYLWEEGGAVLLVQMVGRPGASRIYYLNSLPYWVTLIPPQGSIPSRSSQEFTLRFETFGFRNGEFREGGIVLMGHQKGGPDSIKVRISVAPLKASNFNPNLTPSTLEITDCFPIPFNSTFRLTYRVPTGITYQIVLYDVQGRIVNKLYWGTGVGVRESRWFKTKDLSSGLYFIRLESQQGSVFSKTLLLR